MQVGDLVRIQIHPQQPAIGIVTHLWGNGEVDVLFHDGEYQMNSADLEVVNEGR